MGRFFCYQLIAEGQFGEVYRALDTEAPSTPVAVKKVRTTNGAPHEHMQRRIVMWHEMTVMNHLSEGGTKRLSPYYIPEYVASIIEEGKVPFMVTSLHGQSLQDVLDEGLGLPLFRYHVREIAHQLIRAVAFLHRHGVCHMDIKPGNVALEVQTNVRKADGGFLVLDQTAIRLIDFGCSWVMGTINRTRQRHVIGSPAFRAPEIWFRTGWNHKSDVFSVGATLLNLFTGDRILEPDVRLGHPDVEFFIRLQGVIGPMGKPLYSRLVRRKKDLFHPSGRFIAGSCTEGIPSTITIEHLVNLHPTPSTRWSWWVDHKLIEALRSCLAWDPQDRPSALTASRWPYFDLGKASAWFSQ